MKKPISKQPIPSHAKRVFKGKIFEVYQWRQKLFDGTYTTFEKIKRPSTVMVLPATEEGKIILTEQEQPVEGKFIGALGGIVDEGENVLKAAKRELLEEAGYKAKKWILWDAVQLINKIEWPVYTYIAKGLIKAADIKPDAGERIRLKPVTFEEFVRLASQKNFRDLEITLKVLRARNNPKELTKMQKLFIG